MVINADREVPLSARLAGEEGRRVPGIARIEHPEFPDSICMIGVMDGDEDLSMQYFDSRGIHRLYRIGFDGTELRIWRDAPGFAQRLTAKLSADSSTLEGVWELNEDDRGFRADLAITYRRST